MRRTPTSAPTSADTPPADRDAPLLAALRAGDEQAFATLVTRYHASLKRVARAYVSTDAVAEEVVQDTWLAVIGGIDRFQERASIKTWLFHILANKAKTRGKRERRHRPVRLDRPRRRGARGLPGSLPARGRRLARPLGHTAPALGGPRAPAAVPRGAGPPAGGDR